MLADQQHVREPRARQAQLGADRRDAADAGLQLGRRQNAGMGMDDVAQRVLEVGLPLWHTRHDVDRLLVVNQHQGHRGVSMRGMDDQCSPRARSPATLRH